MLSLYQAERTRAEEQLHQKTTELDSVQESLQVLTVTVKPLVSLSPLL